MTTYRLANIGPGIADVLDHEGHELGTVERKTRKIYGEPVFLQNTPEGHPESRLPLVFTTEWVAHRPGRHLEPIGGFPTRAEAAAALAE